MKRNITCIQGTSSEVNREAVSIPVIILIRMHDSNTYLDFIFRKTSPGYNSHQRGCLKNLIDLVDSSGYNNFGVIYLLGMDF